MPEPTRNKCRAYNDKGQDICDAEAKYVVWGHLFEKRDKGMRCGKHLPKSAHNLHFGMAVAIYDLAAHDAELRERIANKLWALRLSEESRRDDSRMYDRGVLYGLSIAVRAARGKE